MIIRAPRRDEAGWTTISNRIILNPKLTWKAKGILIFLLSRPDNWRAKIAGVIAHAEDGRDAVMTGLRELETAGYIVRERHRNAEDGTYYWNSYVFDEPQVAATVGFPVSGSSGDGSSRDGEAIQLTKTEATKTEQQETSSPLSDSVRRVFEAWVEATERTGRTRLDSKRRRTIEARLKDFPEEDLIEAVRGWRHSPHHRGENDAGMVYNELTLILRNASNVERFRDLERNPPVAILRRPGGYAAATDAALNFDGNRTARVKLALAALNEEDRRALHA